MKTSRILVVDDNSSVSEIVSSFLRQSGRYELRIENNSTWAAAVAREFRPDLAILDVDRPDQDGGEVALEFKSDPILKDITLIFMSGLISAEDKGFRDGVVYLPRSLPLATLERVVEIVLTGHLSAGREPTVTVI